ncbi:hypothetical protein AAFF_G00321640 [Aldrovandia affinis]|uniref:Cell division cycle associated 5 n=1 Tax=Aldrovandia affinis TaxID=143900 RepID=A0AAD7SMF8_9TELE|nr:hypothetical protein AAFF_G00321640 [Aldrovandia affinis]
MTTQPLPMKQGKYKEDNPNLHSPPPRRRSARLCPTDSDENKTVVLTEIVQTVSPGMKRSITFRKIMPRKTQVVGTPGPPLRRSPRVSECNKENVNRLSGTKREQTRMPTSTPASVLLPKPSILSPILAPADPPPKQQQDATSLEWSQKVRRSYSRLSAGDRSFEGPAANAPLSPAPCRRETLFGFAQLQTPPMAGGRAERLGAPAEMSLSVSTSSFSLLEGNGSVTDSPECDVNIPGVAMVKDKKRRKRVPQIKLKEFDTLAAKMNAEFDEAESFDLVVE